MSTPAIHSVRAFNFAHASENLIHDDDTARQFGFRGGLVPGVADFGYLVRPVIELLGEGFLEGGRMAVRFGAPVYDGERVEARAVPKDGEGGVELELRGEDDTVRATGIAEVLAEEPPEASRWPVAPESNDEDRPPASLEALPPGRVMVTIPIPPRSPAELEAISERFCDTHPLWLGPNAALHPARILDCANLVLSQTVRLGPWIHTASDLRLYARPRPEDSLELRGRVIESREHKGHEIVDLDCLLVDRLPALPVPRVWARVRHTAIVRPRQVTADPGL